MFTPPMTTAEWAADQERIRINRAIARRVCGPSDENGAALVVVTPVVPGPGVRIPANEACATLHTLEPVRQESAAIASLEVLPASAFQDMQQTGVLSPELGAPLCGRVVGNGASGRSSCLDLNGRVIERGRLVSWGGLRFKVLRIEGGRAYYGDSFSNSVACGLVQVVA